MYLQIVIQLDIPCVRTGVKEKLLIALVKDRKADSSGVRCMEFCPRETCGLNAEYNDRRGFIAKEQGQISGWKMTKRKHQG